jgi:hypothetical protein
MAPLAGPPPVRSFPGGVLPRFPSFGSSFAGGEGGGETDSGGTDNTGPAGGGAAGDAYARENRAGVNAGVAAAQHASIIPTGTIITTGNLRFRMILWHPAEHGSSIQIRNIHGQPTPESVAQCRL